MQLVIGLCFHSSAIKDGIVTGFVARVYAARSTRAVAAIETAVSGTDIFASSTGNHHIITLDHVGVFLTTRSTSLVQKAGGHES